MTTPNPTALLNSLRALLAAIDNPHPKDFIDEVCTAREGIPEGAIDALAALLSIEPSETPNAVPFCLHMTDGDLEGLDGVAARMSDALKGVGLVPTDEYNHAKYCGDDYRFSGVVTLVKSHL